MLGDWGSVTASGNPDQANLIGQLASSGARFALSTGDIAYPGGSQTNYGDLYQTGADVSAVFGPAFWTVAGASMPLFLVLGNHGFNANFPLIWPGASAAAGSAGRFQMDNYCCLNGTASANYPSVWYAFSAGPARFYMLDAAWANSNLGTGSLYQNDFDYHWTPGSPEYQWLEHDLATHPAQVKFATFHFPLYSANATETSDAFLHGPSSLEGLLSRYGVDIAFNGNAHIYERNNANGPGGLISYVTGGGGAPWSRSASAAASRIVAYAIGWSNSSGRGSACGSASPPVSPSQVFHFLLVSVAGGTSPSPQRTRWGAPSTARPTFFHPRRRRSARRRSTSARPSPPRRRSEEKEEALRRRDDQPTAQGAGEAAAALGGRRPNPARRRLAMGAGVTVGATLLMGGTAQAATFTVDSLNDPVDPGHTTLHHAIAQANAAPNPSNKITFASGLTGSIDLTAA